MVAADEVPEMIVPDGAVGALQTQRQAKEDHAELTTQERRKILVEKLELLGLESWTEENKERVKDHLDHMLDVGVIKPS